MRWHDHRFSENIKFPLFHFELQKITFIREICHTPLRLIIIHQDAFKCIKQEIKHNGFISLHLEYTGSLLNKYHEKQPFYYSVCLPSFTVNSEICP